MGDARSLIGALAYFTDLQIATGDFSHTRKRKAMMMAGMSFGSSAPPIHPSVRLQFFLCR